MKLRIISNTSSFSIGSKDAIGIDLKAIKQIKNTMFKAWYECDFITEIPIGHFGILASRSSISKYDLQLANGIGIVDPDYRGYWQARFNRTFLGSLKWLFTLGKTKGQYQIGDKVAQAVFVKAEIPEIEQVDSLSETERGQGGFGSSGK